MCAHTHWAARGDKHSHWLFYHFSRHNNSNQCYCFIRMKAAVRVCACMCVLSTAEVTQVCSSCGSFENEGYFKVSEGPGSEVKVTPFRRFRVENGQMSMERPRKCSVLWLCVCGRGGVKEGNGKVGDWRRMIVGRNRSKVGREKMEGAKTGRKDNKNNRKSVEWREWGEERKIKVKEEIDQEKQNEICSRLQDRIK